LKVAKKKKKLVEDEEGCDLATLVALTSRLEEIQHHTLPLTSIPLQQVSM
jgi:hypothetical protein